MLAFLESPWYFVGMKTIKLLWTLAAALALGSALAMDSAELAAFELSLQQGLQERSREYALSAAMSVRLEEVAAFYVDAPEFRYRVQNLESVAEGAPSFTPGKPLYVASPVHPDLPPLPDERLRALITDKAKRYLQRQGFDKADSGYAYWLDLAQRWIWRDVLVRSGPRYIVPLFNDRGECVATLVVHAYGQMGSIDSSLRGCKRNYPYLNQADARKRLAEVGVEPAGELRAVHLPGRSRAWPVGACSEHITYDDAFSGVWTDGKNAVGILSGNVYRLTKPFESLDKLASELTFAVEYVHAPDEDPRQIVLEYPGFAQLVACGDPRRSDYAGTKPLVRLPLSVMPRQKRSELLERQIGADAGLVTAEEARKRLEEDWLLFRDLGAMRDLFAGQLPAWLREELAAYPDDTPVREVFHLGHLWFVRSPVCLSERPPQDPLVRLMLDEVAASFVDTGQTPTTDQARELAWQLARILYRSSYYAELVDSQGRCALELSTPAQANVDRATLIMVSCRSPHPITSAQEAVAAFRAAGVEPGGELEAVLLPYRPDPRVPTCPAEDDALVYPYWSDGRYALHSQSGNLYRILPEGLNYLTETPEPYPQVASYTREGATSKYLVFYLPIELEAVHCATGNAR